MESRRGLRLLPCEFTLTFSASAPVADGVEGPVTVSARLCGGTYLLDVEADIISERWELKKSEQVLFENPEFIESIQK